MAIYFIQAGTDGPIKIGLSDDPPFQLIQLQVSHWQTLRLLVVMDGDAAEEARLHGRFSAAFIRGEWHWPVPDLLALIEDHRLGVSVTVPTAHREPSKIIAALGGSTELAREMAKKRSAVSMWAIYGIPARYWPKIARLAARRALLPDANAALREITLDALEASSFELRYREPLTRRRRDGISASSAGC